MRNQNAGVVLGCATPSGIWRRFLDSLANGEKVKGEKATSCGQSCATDDTHIAAEAGEREKKKGDRKNLLSKNTEDTTWILTPF